MKARSTFLAILVLGILSMLSACGHAPPKEKQIKADVLAQGLSEMWISSRADIDDPTQFLSYEISSLSISKRDTRSNEGLDTVWFNFTATNSIHEYSGSAYANYKLYSEGGWILDDWYFESYESHPIAAPRFEELMNVLNYCSALNMPETFDKSSFAQGDYYASAAEASTESNVLGYTYQENVSEGRFPYEQPVATWSYSGKCGNKYGLYTQILNPLYILGYSSDVYLGDDYYANGQVGWYLYNTVSSENGTISSPVSTTRTYAGKTTNKGSDIVLTIIIVDGEPVEVTYTITWKSLISEDMLSEDLVVDIYNVEYGDETRASFIIKGDSRYPNETNASGWLTINVDETTASIRDHLHEYTDIDADDLTLVESNQQQSLTQTDITESQVSQSKGAILNDAADSDWEQKTTEVLNSYVYGLNDAINTCDFSIVEPTFENDSIIYHDQKNLVYNLVEQGIKEKVVSLSVINSWLNDDGTAVVVSKELIGVTYADGNYEEVPQSYAYYMRIQSDGSWLLYQMIEQQN
ncbi:hypothetical protein NE562_00080 [Butyricicoccus faecihominis]|uniref:TcaA NTF2-like domain-containing protein n=1 Tax=Butyricicoccus faecihominis TaxID=1712515 RepID=UPI002478F769|nr:hypothetical protein [Butyricicoccus faecihominis]MCQ5128039.1 hypothetical protein [Butyricicoccus faecihominis]